MIACFTYLWWILVLPFSVRFFQNDELYYYSSLCFIFWPKISFLDGATLMYFSQFVLMLYAMDSHADN